MASKVFIGAGAGFACDRTDAAGPVADTLASLPGARFLIFETLAERTLAQSQLDRRRDAARGYNPALERFVGPVLARCLRDGIKIIGNFGAANPSAAAARIQAMAHAQGLRAPHRNLKRCARPSNCAQNRSFVRRAFLLRAGTCSCADKPRIRRDGG